MSSGFWHPIQELERLPGGWRMPRTRYGNAQGALLDVGGVFEVWIRVGDDALFAGVAGSRADGAMAIWRWGRAELWPTEPPELEPI